MNEDKVTKAYTPPPWTAAAVALYPWRFNVLRENEDGSTTFISEAHEANARLIAAAPELLEALKAAPCHKATNFRVGLAEPSDLWVEPSHLNPCPRCAAINKATGS